MLAIGVSVPSTLAYLQAETEPVKNTFVPVQSVVHDVDITVTGEKVLQGRDWQEGDSFIFVLQLWNAETEKWDTIGTESVAYSKDKTDFANFDFSELVTQQLKEPRYYTFRVVEGQGSLTGMTYDQRVCKFLVHVTADDTGAMDITSVTDKENTAIAQDSETGDFTVNMSFLNTYIKPHEPPVTPDPEDIAFDFQINKKVKNVGDGKIGPDGFDFQLEKNSTGQKWTKTSDAAGSAVFHMTYDKDDIGKVYIYELTELAGKQAGVTYDQREYQIKVGIALDEKENELVPSITLDGKQVSKVEVDFVNTYEAPTEPSKPDEPSDPTKPSEPSQPSEPSEPSEPSKPSEPSDPSDPTKPSDPSEPSDPSDPVEPSEPTDPSDPSDPSEPTDPSVPDVPTDPIGPTEPSKPDQPIGPDDPTIGPESPDDDVPGGKDPGVQTGDDFTVFLYVILLLTSGAIMVMLMRGYRKKTY